MAYVITQNCCKDASCVPVCLSVLSDGAAAPVNWTGWRATGALDRSRGAVASRPRVKLADIDTMLATVRAAASPDREE